MHEFKCQDKKETTVYVSIYILGDKTSVEESVWTLLYFKVV